MENISEVKTKQLVESNNYTHEKIDENKYMGSELKKENKKYKNKLKNSYIFGFIYIFCSIFLEIANFVRLELGFLPTNFGIEMSIIIMIAGIIFIIPTKVLKICISFIFLGIQGFLNIANAMLYSLNQDIFTFDKIFSNFSSFIELFEISGIDIIGLIINLIVLIIFTLSIILAQKFAPKFKIRKNKLVPVYLCILLLSIEVIGFSSFSLFKFVYFNNASAENLVTNNEYWYSSYSNKLLRIKKYGFWSFYINDINSTLTYNSNLEKDELENLENSLQAGNNFKYSTSQYNNENVSGKLKDENLLVLMIDDMDIFFCDKFNTPNLYNFIENKSIKFNNYVSKNETSVNQQISLFGSTTNNHSLNKIYKEVGINKEYSLPNLFNMQGYQSINYVSSNEDKNLINAIGFNNIFLFNDYKKENNQNNELKFIKTYNDMIFPSDKKFFSFINTNDLFNNVYLNGYDEVFEKNYTDYFNYAKENEIGYSVPTKNSEDYSLFKEYKLKAIFAENAFTSIVNYLTTIHNNNEPLINNTTILIYSDNCVNLNYAYRLKNLNKFDMNKQVNNVPMSIFSSKLNKGNIETFCNTYDIYPTICDLYGIEFNNSLVQGNSIFSNSAENSLMFSSQSGIFDKDFYTITLDDYVAIDNQLSTNAKLNSFKQKINNFLKKQEIIEKYYKANYKK